MLSILIANSKGGCGKSTIATNLSAHMALAGHQVMLADADRQKSSLEWAERRPQTAGPIEVANWTKGPLEVPRHITRLIVDGPAGLRKSEVEDLIERVDLVVMPILPSVFDQRASDSFLAKLDELKSIRKNRKGVAIVGNRVRERTKAAERLDKFLAGLGHAVVTRLRDSQAYGDAAAAGLSIFEMKGARLAPLKADWRPLIDYIEHGVL
jgi:chromosome partitioning protein